MTIAIWTLATLGLIMSIIGIFDIIKELKFCLPGVVTDQDFESKRPVAVSCRWAFGFRHSENRLALKKQSLGLQAAPTENTISKSEGKTL